jgi:hypothetical protein
MTKEKLEALQVEISEEIIRVVDKKCVAGRTSKLEELNLMLDSLNRAAYYLMKSPE